MCFWYDCGLVGSVHKKNVKVSEIIIKHPLKNQQKICTYKSISMFQSLKSHYKIMTRTTPTTWDNIENRSKLKCQTSTSLIEKSQKSYQNWKFVRKIVLTINILFIYYLYYISYNHRVSIEGKSPQKESFSVNSPWKMFGVVSQPQVA